MQYMLLIYGEPGRWETLTEEERGEISRRTSPSRRSFRTAALWSPATRCEPTRHGDHRPRPERRRC